MRLDPEVEDSQIPDSYMPQDELMKGFADDDEFAPPSHQPEYGNDNDIHQLVHISQRAHHDEQVPAQQESDSLSSLVDKTQLDYSDPESAQESLRSVVGETQFDSIQMDTQARTDKADVDDSSEIMSDKFGSVIESPPSTSIVAPSQPAKLFAMPTLENDQNDFTFGKKLPTPKFGMDMSKMQPSQHSKQSRGKTSMPDSHHALLKPTVSAVDHQDNMAKEVIEADHSVQHLSHKHHHNDPRVLSKKTIEEEVPAILVPQRLTACKFVEKPKHMSHTLSVKHQVELVPAQSIDEQSHTQRAPLSATPGIAGQTTSAQPVANAESVRQTEESPVTKRFPIPPVREVETKHTAKSSRQTKKTKKPFPDVAANTRSRRTSGFRQDETREQFTTAMADIVAPTLNDTTSNQLQNSQSHGQFAEIIHGEFVAPRAAETTHGLQQETTQQEFPDLSHQQQTELPVKKALQNDQVTQTPPSAGSNSCINNTQKVGISHDESQPVVLPREVVQGEDVEMQVQNNGDNYPAVLQHSKANGSLLFAGCLPQEDHEEAYMQRPESRHRNPSIASLNSTPSHSKTRRQVQQHDDVGNIQFVNNAKVGKSRGGQQRQAQEKVTSKPVPIDADVSQRGLSAWLCNGQSFIRDFEKQKKQIEVQKEEIDSLKNSGVKSVDTIKQLEQAIQIRDEEIGIFKMTRKKLTDHFNKVVTAQRELVDEGNKIRKKQQNLLESVAHKNGEVEASKEAIRGAHQIFQIGAKLKKLRDDTLSSNADLEAQVKECESTPPGTVAFMLRLTWLVIQSKSILQKDLDSRLLDLGRERHNTELLQKQLKEQSENHKELVELIKNDTSSNVLHELTKSGGMIETLMKSDNSIKDRLEDFSSLLNELKITDHTNPALVKLVGDSFLRIEGRLQTSDSNRLAQTNSILKRSEDLNISIDQLGDKIGNQELLKDQMHEIREQNAASAATLAVKESECQKLFSSIEELSQELSSYREKLALKSEELAVALATPHDDSSLTSKIDELTSKNSDLRGQVDTANQEAIRIANEMTDLQEASTRSQEKIKELKEKVRKAHESLRAAQGEGKRLVEVSEKQIVKAKQEVARNAAEARKEMEMKHASTVHNLEQMRDEAEGRERVARAELAELQSNEESNEEEISSYKDKMAAQAEELQRLSQRPDARTVESIISGYVTQLDLQKSHLEKLEIRASQNKKGLEEIGQELESAQVEVAKLQSDLETTRAESARKIEMALQKHDSLENRLQQVNTLLNEKAALIGDKQLLEAQKKALERENAELKQQQANSKFDHDALQTHNTELEGEKGTLNTQQVQLQQDLDIIVGAVSRHLRRQDEQITPETVKAWALNVPVKTPPKSTPAFPPPGDVLQAHLDRTYNAAGTVKRRPESQITNPMSSLVASVSTPQIKSALAAPSSVQRGSHMGSQSSNSGTPRLKVTNRKPSNLAQQYNAGVSARRQERSCSSMVETTTTHTMQRIHETTTRVQTPSDQMIPAARAHRGSLEQIHRPETPVDDTVPFSQLPHFGSGSESFAKQHKPVPSRGNDGTAIPNPRANRSPKKTRLPRNVAPPKYNFSDSADEDLEYDGPKKRAVTSSNAAMTDSAARKTPPALLKSLPKKAAPSKPLKSAMKDTNYNHKETFVSEQNARGDQAYDHAGRGLPDKPARGINRATSQSVSGVPRRGSGVSGMKGVVSGSSSGRIEASQAHLSTSQDDHQYKGHHKSPPMAAPSRNKRRASNELRGGPAKIPKIAPYSSTTTQVPDSQGNR
ncbi:hypothetical protein BJ878DRAFT_558681 [Calycina marina]|uniref:Uncharacterized protein n=1 Tax=Calycina marina TaxID=1763456 RepID=A0A9P7Z7W0_9HELO|nr:hypothetical protein BJ878DRAFT_558681 [Calycina marina]